MIPELLMFCNIEPYASYYVCITNILFDHLKQYHWITTCVLFVECRYSIQVQYCIACIMKFKNKSEKRKEGYISYERQIIWKEIRRGHFVKSHGLKQEIVQSVIKKPTIFDITLTQISLEPTLIVGNFQLLYR